MSITWDFTRQIDAAASPGATTSYFDTMCQSIYLDSGQIKTQIAQVENGQWQDINPEDEIAISESGFDALDIEHHFNGTLAGSAQHDSDVVLLLYEYMIDVSAWLKSGSWRLQPDNSIKGGDIELVNADKTRFQDDAYTLFSPGNRLRFRFRSAIQNHMKWERYILSRRHILIMLNRSNSQVEMELDSSCLVKPLMNAHHIQGPGPKYSFRCFRMLVYRMN